MAALVSLPDLEMTEREYLTGDFEVDCDYVDGRIEERNVGELDHSKWQLALILWFAQHKREWGLSALPELRLKVAERRYRVPDVCVFAADRQPTEAVLSAPPLVVFEILSPDDRFSRVQVRLSDFERMGVKNIFVLQSDTEFFRFENGGFVPVTSQMSALEGSSAFVDWSEVATLRF